MIDLSNTFALFVDVMGFSNAVEALSQTEFDEVRIHLEAGLSQRPTAANGQVVFDRYKIFHDYLQTGHEARAFRQVGGIHSTMLFSDCAYIIARDGIALSIFAKQMMRHLLLSGIPIRMGIGHGTFARLTFANTVPPDGSIISAAPFLGTAIVRAHRAQNGDPPGFRILVDPSAHATVMSDAFCLSLMENERNDRCVSEIAYVNWPADIRDANASLAKMREGVTSDRAHRHYDATAVAFECFARWEPSTTPR